MTVLPVMRPQLPALSRLAPYLSMIDEARIYSNFGPITHRFEERLGERYGLNRLASVSNATIGIALALTAQGVKAGTLCIIPAWTFVASAHAAIMAGLVPYFVDVDKETWSLDPATVQQVIETAPGEVGAIMPVMPFGQVLDLGAWESFYTQSKIPVVIDAAAAFDAIVPSAVPTVVSLHATKVLGIGEGGFVMSTQPGFLDDIRCRSNFGFSGSRLSQSIATNAKLSEYHSAIGMAALDEWAEARSEWVSIGAAYQAALSRSDQFRLQKGFAQSWIASTCVIDLCEPLADAIETALSKANIETRRWWGTGTHEQPSMAAFPRSELGVTSALSKTTIGLPFFRDLPLMEIDRVVEAVMTATETQNVR